MYWNDGQNSLAPNTWTNGQDKYPTNVSIAEQYFLLIMLLQSCFWNAKYSLFIAFYWKNENILYNCKKFSKINLFGEFIHFVDE